MKRVFLNLLSFCVLLGACVVMQPVLAQNSRTDKVQTYIMPDPYPVEKIVSPEGKKVKNVILMIGDGMSLMHVYSAWTANRGKLYLENCPVVGLSKTYCANKLITDSGAGGTAMAIGQKTNYHSVGVDAQGNPQPSLVTLAKQKGLYRAIQNYRGKKDISGYCASINKYMGMSGKHLPF